MNNELNEKMAEVMGWKMIKCSEIDSRREDFYIGKDNLIVMLVKDWNPTTDPDQAMWCVEMADTDILIAKDRVSWAVNGCRCETRDDIPLAICNAIFETT